jgi:hypothetical protein
VHDAGVDDQGAVDERGPGIGQTDHDRAGVILGLAASHSRLRTMRPWSLARHASLTTSEPHGSVRRQPNAQQRASSEGVRLKWGKSGAKPALSRSCNRVVHGSGARMPASAWMPATRGLQDRCDGSVAAAPHGREESAGSFVSLLHWPSPASRSCTRGGGLCALAVYPCSPS